MSTHPAIGRVVPFREILAYTTGDGVNSLILNSMGFCMLYYTQALGVDYRRAALALSIATLWNAVTEPVMGHITDNTRSRLGRRHPYMLLGGVFTVIFFFLVWMVPQPFRAPHLLFWYVLVVSLLLRTGITVFAVPYGALGFEICTDYNQRTTLQGMRVGANMLINLAGPAMAWAIFFRDQEHIESTSIPSNYIRMGSAFSIAALAFVLLAVFATRKHMVDTRRLPDIVGNRPREVLRSIREIIRDRCPRPVFLFAGIVFVGMSLVASLEMYVYIHFMQFSSFERTSVHAAGIVACGLGGLLSPALVRRVDKKAAACIAVVVVAAANILLAMLFIPRLLVPGADYRLPDGIPGLSGGMIPLALLAFLILHSFYWAGNGILTPIAGSMIADASEICRYRTGVLKDGGYSAMLSCITKLSVSIGLLLSGYCLNWAGFLIDNDRQTPQAVRNLAMMTFLGGAAIALVAMLALVKYPVTEQYMRDIKKALAEQSQASCSVDVSRTAPEGAEHGDTH